MNKAKVNKEAKHHFTTHWWNMGAKTLDFKGSYKDYFEEKKIKISIVKHPTLEDTKGLRLQFPLGSYFIRIDSFDGDIIKAFQMVIKTQLTYLGDKALFSDGYNEYKINWR